MKLQKILLFGLWLIFLFGFAGAGHRKQDVQSVQRQMKSGYLEVSDGKLYYEVAGEGEWIVLVHDGNLHSVTWDEQWSSDNGFPYFFDLILQLRVVKKQSVEIYPIKKVANLHFLLDKAIF